MDLQQTFRQLESLYDELPEAPCVACGLCCVSPHMTFLEFAHLLQGMLTNWPPQRLHDLVHAAPGPEKRYPGNYVCRVQGEKGLCELYPWRSLMCRLEGFPVLDRMGIREVQICPYITDEQVETRLTPAQVDAWVQRLYALDAPWNRAVDEPYWLTGLNLECWLAVALDEKITQLPVRALRNHLRAHFDLDPFAASYVDTTRLADKLELIDRFFQEAHEFRRPRRAVALLNRILGDFPRTGTHFQAEGRQYLELMRAIVRDQSAS